MISHIYLPTKSLTVAFLLLLNLSSQGLGHHPELLYSGEMPLNGRVAFRQILPLSCLCPFPCRLLFFQVSS